MQTRPIESRNRQNRELLGGVQFVSPADPASRWTGANGGLAFFAYCTNYLIDLEHAVILDVEATTAVRQAE